MRNVYLYKLYSEKIYPTKKSYTHLEHRFNTNEPEIRITTQNPQNIKLKLWLATHALRVRVNM